MPIHNHAPNRRGRAALWTGALLGLVFLVGLVTRGFGLFANPGHGGEATPALKRQGNTLVVPEGSPLRSRLSVQPAATQRIQATLALPGVVESDPARTTNVLTPVSGRIVALKVALGERVAAGQALAVIDSPDLAQAYDDDAKAADTLRLTTRNLEREQAQHELGVVSERDLDQARSDHTQAGAEYRRTQARLRVLGTTAERGAAPRGLVLRAPAAGSITALSAAPGSMVNDPTQPLMTIADLSTVWVTAMVPEADLAGVSKGQDAEVALLAYPGQSLHGKVLFVADVVDADTRRTRVRIAFANPTYAYKPNMYATVTLKGAGHERVVLPSSALLMNNDRTSVFVASSPWVFERRTVQTDLEQGQTIAIRSGVAAGEAVVVKGGILLND